MERCKMLTEEQLKKIQEAMEDTEFAKSVSETKTEEEIVSLLKDKKGITVSVEDIKDLVETVRKIPTEELNVAGGKGWWEALIGVGKGIRSAVGLGKAGELGKVFDGSATTSEKVGVYGTYTVAAATALAAVSALGYGLYKKYYSKSGGEAAATSGDSSATQQVSAE